jgi:N4-gp56 family major capsid protein
MAIQTTSNLSNAVRTKYSAAYLQAAMSQRVYDQLAIPVGDSKFRLESGNWLGSSYLFNFASDMTPSTSAISQSVDIVPQVLRDSTASITPTSRGDALQWAEALDLQAYTPYGEQRFTALGKNMMESVDLLAQAEALQGGLVKRAVARASLDAGTSGHRFTDSAIAQMASLVKTLKCPPLEDGSLVCIVHTDAFYDLVQGGNVVTIAQQVKPEILMNQEVGSWAGFRIIATPWAKVFGGAGADNGSNAATTLNGAVNALAKTIVVAADTNITAGLYLTIGTEETGNTHHATNELVRVSADYSSGTTVDIIGEGANGGLRFDHASGISVRNADNAYPAVFGSRGSLIKVFANEVGEFGETVGPKDDGILNQFTSLGWKFYGGYGLVAENYIARGEYSSSLQA